MIGLVVTDICMRTMAFGLQSDEKTSFAIMDRAINAGIDFFDMGDVRFIGLKRLRLPADQTASQNVSAHTLIGGVIWPRSNNYGER